MKTEPDYRLLASVLIDALNQAQNGKGKERHACGEPFEQQEICQNTRAVGFGYPLGQARKKAREAKRLLETIGKDAAIAECLGAINYLAAAVIVMEEQSVNETDFVKNDAGQEADHTYTDEEPEHRIRHDAPGQDIRWTDSGSYQPSEDVDRNNPPRQAVRRWHVEGCKLTENGDGTVNISPGKIWDYGKEGDGLLYDLCRRIKENDDDK